MDFNNKFTDDSWAENGTTAEPSENLRQSGFQGGYKPPANVFNWFWRTVMKAVTELQTKLSGVDSAVSGKADASALTAHTGNKNNPHSVTKAQVGLGNVDNTSDLNKPISTAVEAALEGKADKGSTGTVTAYGGFQGGTDASVTTLGGAIGKNATTSLGGSVGYSTTSTSGGAVGNMATASSGGAIGQNATTTNGGAAGCYAESADGGAVGSNTKTGNGFAGGYSAKTVNGTTAIDAIQLGTGTNPNEKTMQVYNKQVVAYDSAGSTTDDKWYLKDVGKLSALATSVKTSIVNAINSLKTLLDTHTGNTTVHVTSTEKSAWNGKANASHKHGNITNGGKIGTTANKAVYTGTSGVLQAGTLPVSAGGTGATSASSAPFLAKTGGTMTGTLTAQNTSATTAQVRNIQIGDAAPSSLTNGVIYLQYE